MKDESIQSIGELAILLLSGLVMYPIVVFLAQVYALLQHGAWIEVPAMQIFLPVPTRNDIADPNNLLIWIPAFDTWLADPGNWLGVHVAVSWLLNSMNAAVFMFLAIIFIYLGGAMTLIATIDAIKKVRKDGFL